MSVTVPGPPVGILFPEVRTTSVRLIWQPPAQPNGIILGAFHNIAINNTSRPNEAPLLRTGCCLIGFLQSNLFSALLRDTQTDVQFSLFARLLRSLSDHVQEELVQQQRRHRGRAEPERATVHGGGAEGRVGLRVPTHCSDPQGMGGGGRGVGGHHGEER